MLLEDAHVAVTHNFFTTNTLEMQMQAKKRKHSLKFKRKIVAMKLAGASATELGAKYNIVTSLIHKWADNPAVAKATKPSKPSKAAKPKPGKPSNDIKRIVSELMKGWEQTLEDALTALVDLAVQRKLDNLDSAIRVANENLIKTLKGAA